MSAAGACPTCDSSATRVLYRFPPSSLVPVAAELLDEVLVARCQRCGMVYTNAVRLSVEQLARLYDQEMFESQDHWKQVSLDAIEDSPDFPYYTQVLDQLGPGDGRRLIDIGCGLGIFLAAAGRRGWTVEGTELSEYAAQKIRDRLGCPVHLGEVEHLQLPGESFEVVSSWDLLEHVRDVRANLRAMFDLLKPGGWLVLRTINEGALIVQLTALIYRLTGGRCYGPVRRAHEIYHLHYFTHRTLRELLTAHGFRLERLIRHDTPVQRLALPRRLWPAMRCIYAVQRVTGTQFKQTILAQKP